MADVAMPTDGGRPVLEGSAMGSAGGWRRRQVMDGEGRRLVALVGGDRQQGGQRWATAADRERRRGAQAAGVSGG